MEPIHVETVVQADGELHLSDLPFHKGDRVEAVIVIRNTMEDQDRLDARRRFLDRARNSKVCSSGPYSTRDQLHERG
jgi:hypothetical protein